MADDPEIQWPWPGSLDALEAAPEHHRLLMENEKVRVIDTCIRPGETTALHTHQWPASLYVLSWSDFIRYDEQDNVVLHSKDLKTRPLPSSALWSGPLPLHKLKNIGDQDLHIISVEIKP